MIYQKLYKLVQNVKKLGIYNKVPSNKKKDEDGYNGKRRKHL